MSLSIPVCPTSVPVFLFLFFCLNTLYYNPLSVSLFVFFILTVFFCPRVSPLRFVFVFPVYIIYDTVISFYGCRSFHWLSLFMFCILVFFFVDFFLSLLSFPLCSLSSFVSLSVLFLFISCFSLSCFSLSLYLLLPVSFSVFCFLFFFGLSLFF